MDVSMGSRRPPKVPQTDAAELPGNSCPAVATEGKDGEGWRGRSRQGEVEREVGLTRGGWGCGVECLSAK